MTGHEAVEHAVRMAGGGMHIRPNNPAVDQIYPLNEWIKNAISSGALVYRRRVITVTDWERVTAETEDQT